MSEKSVVTREERRVAWRAIGRIPKAVAKGVAAELRERDGDDVFARFWAEPSQVPAWEWCAPLARKELATAEREIAAARRVDARVVCIDDVEYPQWLREIADPPPALFVRGRILPQDVKAVAVIGSRSATRYGVSTTRRLVPPLVPCGVTIVSGMARGIDSEAHRAALGAGGRTIAVLGTGIDVPYPRESRDLYDSIPERGAVVSEMPPLQGADKFVFLRRNRIISGISKAVIVVEAKARSGTSVTARLANEQGRAVGAVPGDADLERSAGTNQLLSEGAFVVRDAIDVLAGAFGELHHWERTPMGAPLPALDPMARSALDALSAEPRSLDALIAAIRVPAGPLLASISRLERAGLVKRDDAGRFLRSGGEVAQRTVSG